MLILAFMVSDVHVYAQGVIQLPVPGTRLALSSTFAPPMLKGIKVYRHAPFKFDFILDKGDAEITDEQVKTDSTRLIKYFLASLTVPEKDLWVNLSPYEKDRIVPEAFGQTEMGRDLLAQDYILKQITASVIYPDEKVGKEFWGKVYAEALKRYGTTDVPVDTFNKVWIIPEKATVYENKDAAFVVESKLKVMLESDYVAMSNNPLPAGGDMASFANVSPNTLPSELTLDVKAIRGFGQTPSTNELTKDIIREIVMPILQKEINEGKNFATLRQVYNSLILATWYKRKVKASIMGQAYVDKKMTVGIDIIDKNEKEKIWKQYVEAFKKGVFNLIREEQDALTQEVVPRKYFSGGTDLTMSDGVFSSESKKLPEVTCDRMVVIYEKNNVLVNEEDSGILKIKKSDAFLTKLFIKSRKTSLWRISDKDEDIIRMWLQTIQLDLPNEASILRKLFIFIYDAYMFEPGRGVHYEWLDVLRNKWHLNTVKQLTNLLRWMRTSSINIQDISDDVFMEFMQAYIRSYNEFPGWRDNFNYISVPGLNSNQQLAVVLGNMKRMMLMSPAELVQRKAILKSYIAGTNFFIGIEYGLVESTHGWYVILGEDKKMGRSNDFDVIFKMGVDTQGNIFRIVMLQGEKGKLNEINEEVPSKFGMHPALMLMYVALQIAHDGGLKIVNRPEFNIEKQKFTTLLGIRRKYMPAIKYVGDDIKGGININVNYSRFGLRKELQDFGYWQDIDHLMQTTIPNRLNSGDLKAISIKKLLDTLNHLQLIPDESFRSEYSREIHKKSNVKEGEPVANTTLGIEGHQDIAVDGGINFNPAIIDMTIKSSDEQISFNMDKVMLEQLQHASGVTPVIVGIHSLDSLSVFMGVQPSAVK